jgi:hypothetical protein
MEGHFTQMSNESRELLSGYVAFFTLPNSRNEEPVASDKSEQGALEVVKKKKNTKGRRLNFKIKRRRYLFYGVESCWGNWCQDVLWGEEAEEGVSETDVKEDCV